LNEVYDEVIDVIVLAADHFKANKALVKQLSYNGVLKTVKGPKPPKKPKAPKNPPTNPI
jgi:hypothetical protein